jgi:hypothetical protein
MCGYIPTVPLDGGITSDGFYKTYGAAHIFRIYGKSGGKRSANYQNQYTHKSPSFYSGIRGNHVMILSIMAICQPFNNKINILSPYCHLPTSLKQRPCTARMNALAVIGYVSQKNMGNIIHRSYKLTEY